MRSTRFRIAFFATFAAVFLLSAFSAHAAIINIPDDQPTIQAGIDIAAESDTVLVAPGTYFENLDLREKSITLASHYLTTADTTYMHETIIDAQKNGDSCINIRNDEEGHSVTVSGFTLKNAAFTLVNGYGTAIRCKNVDAHFRWLIFERNDGYSASGISCGISNITIDNSYFRNNDSGSAGGVLSASFCDISINNTFIYNNNDPFGLYFNNCDSVLCNNIIVKDNKHVGVLCVLSSATIKNSVIADNGEYDLSAGSNDITIINSVIFSQKEYHKRNIRCSGCTIRFINSIIWDSTKEEQISVPWELPSNPKATLIFSNSIIKSGLDGIVAYYPSSEMKADIFTEGELYDFDPLFIDTDNGDFRLQESSPAIDAGVAYFQYEGEVILDMKAEDYHGVAPDIGAYEYDPTVSVEKSEIMPQTAMLMNPSPNPFNPSTTISFTLSEPSEIVLSIYNLNGQHVTDLVSRRFAAGVHSAVWNAGGCASGVYFCVLDTGGAMAAKRVLLVR